jgi:hypothetical protein
MILEEKQDKSIYHNTSIAEVEQQNKVQTTFPKPKNSHHPLHHTPSVSVWKPGLQHKAENLMIVLSEPRQKCFPLWQGGSVKISLSEINLQFL